MSIKKIFFFVLLTSAIFQKGYAEINDSLFMTIGNKAITKSNIVNEIKIILILNNESYSDEKRDILHDMAVKTIIKRTIKKIEIEKNNFLKFKKTDLEKELNKLANKINMDLDTLKNICESNELDFSMIEDQIKTELYWNSLIFELYKNRLKVNSDEIEEKLRLIKDKKEINEYLISEVIVKLTNENDFESQVKNLKNKIQLEGFEKVAKNLSISESAINSGDLGWLNENIISRRIKPIIINTPVGSLSKAILLDGNIVIFKVINKREIKNTQTLEEMKDQIVHSEKLKILNMHSLSHYDKLRRSVTVKFFQ